MGRTLGDQPEAISRRAWPTLGAAAFAVLVLFAVAPAQDAPSPVAPSSAAPAPAPDAAPPTAPAPDPPFRPGFVHAFGRWLEEGASRLKSGVEGAQEKLGSFGSKAREAAKDATGAITTLPGARMISGRERCALASNGAPDCPTAATVLCRGKGFEGGRVLDTQGEQKCPARVLLEGRSPNAGNCPTETFVTRAMCQ
jgi:hypothetical protein